MPPNMKQFLTSLAMSTLTVLAARASDQPISPAPPTSSRICGSYSCERVPAQDLSKPYVAGQSKRDRSPSPTLQQRPASQKASGHEPTSTDLYCESMAMAFVEYMLDYKPPSSPAHAKQVDSVEGELLETCKSMPIIGGKEKKQRELTSHEISQMSCLGIADGIATAQASKTEDRLLYSKLSQNRLFFSKACASNRKQFLSDMKKYGPYHVLSKTY
jgi:hypothetical protein